MVALGMQLFAGKGAELVGRIDIVGIIALQFISEFSRIDRLHLFDLLRHKAVKLKLDTPILGILNNGIQHRL